MVTPVLKGIHVMSEDWTDEDDFWVGLDAFVGTDDFDGFEVFSFQIVSPKRLKRVLDEEEIEVGRGLLIANHYDIARVESTIRRLIGTCERSNWNEMIMAVNCFGRWQE